MVKTLKKMYATSIKNRMTKLQILISFMAILIVFELFCIYKIK